MTRPLVEIRGPWLLNKGDALMLRAAVDALGGQFDLAAEGGLGERRVPRDAGVEGLRWGAVPAARLSKGWMTRTRRAEAHRDAALLALPGVPRRLRIRDGRDVVGLLDASGFAYGDQWNPARMGRRADYYAMLRARGVRLVLAPQAVGPFEKPEVRATAHRLFGLFDRVWARDAASLEHLRGLDLPGDRLARAPDITHLLHGPPPPRGDWSGRACVVPNARMLDRTDGDVSARYRDFLLTAVGLLRERGADPFLMLHETNDADLAAEIADRSGGMEVIDPPALEAKSILGACRMVLSSRYHALVGSLSQAAPTIGTSWAHKYDALFEEYDCADMLLSPAAPEDALAERLTRALEPGDLRSRLARAAAAQAARVEAMWEEARGLLAPGSLEPTARPGPGAPPARSEPRAPPRPAP